MPILGVFVQTCIKLSFVYWRYRGCRGRVLSCSGRRISLRVWTVVLSVIPIYALSAVRIFAVFIVTWVRTRLWVAIVQGWPLVAELIGTRTSRHITQRPHLRW